MMVLSKNEMFHSVHMPSKASYSAAIGMCEQWVDGLWLLRTMSEGGFDNSEGIHCCVLVADTIYMVHAWDTSTDVLLNHRCNEHVKKRLLHLFEPVAAVI